MAYRSQGWCPVMGGLIHPMEQKDRPAAGSVSRPSAYATVHGPHSRRGGLFTGKLVCKTELGQERLITDYTDTSFKAINDELCKRRLCAESVAAIINEMSLRLEEARDQKERQDLQRMDSSFVMLYQRERLIGDRPEIAVYLQSVGFNTMTGAQQGYEGDNLPLGPAEDGDEIIVKRGVVRITAPIFLECSLTFSREKNYAGGGGGGWSGGGGGGYGLGGGGGGGTYVRASATNVEIKVGTQYKRGQEVVVGNSIDGSVHIREPIMGEDWHFESIEGAQEWLPPRTCIYIIKAKGGAGASAGTFRGGTGASVEAMFQLEENTPVILVVGKMGQTYSDRWGSCGGGGGATCVFHNKTEAERALIVAGGGGGAAAPYSSKGSDGGHANLTPNGKNGLGPFHGEGGQHGRAGTTRHIRTCFLNALQLGCARFMGEDKVKAVCLYGKGFFPGAGSGILEFALGSANGASHGDHPKGPGGVAAGGFGGGGCGDWHPEETRIEGHGVDSIFHCRAGNPVIRDQVLCLTGHVTGAEFQPQCILVDGGVMLAEQIDMVCSEGNACVAKSHKKSRHDNSRPGVLHLIDCTVNHCGANGLLVIDGGCLEASHCKLTACKKDGLDVKGEGSTAAMSKCEIRDTGARHVIVSKGAKVTVSDCTMDNSHSSGCVSMGQGSSLKLQRCLVNATNKNGILITEGATCELRKCNVIASHDVGILAIGVEDKVLNEETSVRVLHCVIRKNGYGVWAQDGAALKLLGGVVSGSVNQDITQHSQPNMKTANKLISLGSQLRVFFVTWKKETQTTKVLQDRLKGLRNEELDEMILNIFKEFDVDGSGEIHESELGEAIETLGIHLNESDIHNLLQEMDEDNDGKLSIAEFTLFSYNLVNRKRSVDRRVHDLPTHGQLLHQDARRDIYNKDEGNRFIIPQASCAIVIRALRPELEKMLSPVHDTQELSPAPSSDVPLAFSINRPAAAASSSRKKLDLSQIYQVCENGRTSVSRYFSGEQALVEALADAGPEDLVLLGPGRHYMLETAKITKSIGICCVDYSQECEVICKLYPAFEIVSGNITLAGLKLSKMSTVKEPAYLNIKGGDVLLQNCFLESMSGCAITCTVENIDCNVTCTNCRFVNASHSYDALIAKGGAVAKLIRCEVVGSSLYATSGGLIHVEACQLVESAHDSIIVDSDGVVKAYDSKVIGSLQNGIAVGNRGMLTLHRCSVIRSRKIGLVCTGLRSTVHLTESSIREGWSHGAQISDGALAEFEQSSLVINKGTGCFARGSEVRVVSSNEQDGVWVEDGARADIWSLDLDIGEGAMIRQNGWCGVRVSGPSTSVKCSQAKIKLNTLHGLLAEHGATVSARLLDVDANTGTGILATHDGTVVDMFGCTSTGNRVGLACFSSLIRANNCHVVRNMENYLKDQEQLGRVEVDQLAGKHRATSELLPRIHVSRGHKAKPPRPATPVKKPGEHTRLRTARRGAATFESFEAGLLSPSSGVGADSSIVDNLQVFPPINSASVHVEELAMR